MTKPTRFPASLVAAATLAVLAAPSFGLQADRPAPTAPRQPDQVQRGERTASVDSADSGPGSRRQAEPGQVKLAFNDVGIKDTIPFIATATGKVVMPLNLLALQTKKITLVNDEPVDRSVALDLLFQAFRINGVGVIEREDVLIVGMIEEIMLLKQHPVLSSDDDVLSRQDKGSLVAKIYRLYEAPVDMVGEQLQENLPTYASLTIDTNSNQLMLYGDIALCQHVQRIIDELDHSYLAPKTETFRLAYADASQIADNILELFEPDPSQGNVRNAAAQRRSAARSAQRGAEPGSSLVGPEIELRVTVNTLQNSVTVSAEPAKVKEIRRLIEEEWDRPRPTGTSKIYTLKYTDPIKVAEKLNSLLGQGGSTGGARRPGRTQTGGADGTVQQILSGIYQIEPYEDTSQLFVFCKTEEAILFLDDFIEKIDRPTSIGLPFVVELKHANAVELSQELNALLAEAGASADLDAPEEGLSGRPDSTGGGTGGGSTGGTGGTGGGTAGRITFPWTSGGRQSDEQSPESSLIGKVRIVPIVRQNALAVLCPAPQQEAVRELIENFDRPGRQVMISAVIVGVELTDELELGLRFSDQALTSLNPDNRVSGAFEGSASENDFFGSLFDTSVLDLSFNLNVALQALSQQTNVRLMQEPVLYTADNQEAIFFQGSDISFRTGEVTDATGGGATTTTEQREVGLTLNVRPRITSKGTVDLEVLLALSNIIPGEEVNGNPLVDRRETRTHVILNDGQTILIAGILKDQDSQVTRKVPLLGDIPLLGEVFKSRENVKTTTEILAFITPYVVNDPEESDYNFNVDWLEHLERIRRPLSEQFEEYNADPEAYIERMIPRDRATGSRRPAPSRSTASARDASSP